MLICTFAREEFIVAREEFVVPELPRTFTLNPTAESPVLPRGVLSPDPLGGGKAAIPLQSPLQILHRVHPHTLLRGEKSGQGLSQALSRLTPGRDPPEPPHRPHTAGPCSGPCSSPGSSAEGTRGAALRGAGGRGRGSARPPPAPSRWLRGAMRAGPGCRGPSSLSPGFPWPPAPQRPQGGPGAELRSPAGPKALRGAEGERTGSPGAMGGL